ncbi:MAG: pyruvate formate lyase family protein [Christensenellales bacterium]|mgnify:CR=1 FL=1|jgi:pyruvate formate-lyase/glycerol dehydratase family glycyl radical enzyme
MGEKSMNVIKIQRTSVHDGSGLRTTIFFRGCPLRCKWCQNPEMLSKDTPLYENNTLEGILEEVFRDKEYYLASGGGITLSGGEPLIQDADKLVSLLSAIKKEGINTAVETTLCAPYSTIEKILQYVDLFLVDIKVAGNNEKHKELTGIDNNLIQENLQKLVQTNAKIRFRMVMIPGLNDREEHIEEMAKLLKSFGYDVVELLKYHNMYEDKAKRLGLEIPMLNITPEQSLCSLKQGLEFFQKYGINAYNIKENSIKRTAKFTDRVNKIQQDIRDAGRSLCIEVDKLKTKFYRKNGFKEPVHIHRAKRLKYVFENKSIKVYDQELLVGNFTAKRCGGQVWVEQYGVLDISFLYKINRQTPVSFKISAKDRWYFYTRMAPFWVKRGVLGKVANSIPKLMAMLGRSAEMIAGFNNNMAAIAHFIPNYDRILKKGTTGLIEKVKEEAKSHPENDKSFYEGAIICLEGLANWADRYSLHLTNMAKNEQNCERKKELEKMAAICKKVPRYKAETFYEALQSILFIQIALCNEAYENAISFGRLDQILYPYYKADLDAGRITYDEAKELLALFCLKIDEVILVNDGDSLLNIAKLFETLSVDQALTFGGTDKEGNDATNDLTYMLIDICELQPLAINMCARINKNSPKKYLDRLAEIYINGCPMPELFSDEEYFEAIIRKHDTTMENARNYAIVGCVEPIASDDHFGNTDSANVNMALPFLQAMKGHEHDLWNYSNKEYLKLVVDRFYEYSFGKYKKCPYCKMMINRRNKSIEKRKLKKGMYIYNPPSSMEELLARYKVRLQALTNSVLADQQRIIKILGKDFTTPLASSLYDGCLKRGKCAYQGGTDFISSGIQGIGVTDVADSLYAIDKLVFTEKKYSMLDIIKAIDSNYEGEENQRILADINAIPKFGDDSSQVPVKWVNLVLKIWNDALASVPTPDRGGKYVAGYYALNVNDRYGLKTQALPSGRLKGVPFANSITPHYGMEESNLMSSLNAVAAVNYKDLAPNGTTVTFHIDSALFPGQEGIENLSSIFKVFLTTGGMQFQPNVISRDILIDAYNNPEKYKYLMVRVAGYCSYFNELSDDLKKVIINRTCYA